MTISVVTDTTTVAGKTIKKFTTDLAASTSQAQDTTTWTCPQGITSVRYLIVAGGGSGGAGSGGGGGAGGMLTGTIAVTPGTTYTIKVGAGGARVQYVSTWIHGIKGGNSEFTAVGTVAIGGGYGGAGYNTFANRAGGSGGSGGGGSNGGAVGTGTSGQGNNGGTDTGEWGRAGGGGGAGGAGGNADKSPGGLGLASDITGTSLYYAGGGGGMVDFSSAGYGVGGSGVGGNGYKPGPVHATSGTNGRGGGGGGTRGNNTYYSGDGGSGVVILQYDNPTALIRSGIEWL